MATEIVAGIVRDFREFFPTTEGTVTRAKSTIIKPDIIRLHMNLLLVA